MLVTTTTRGLCSRVLAVSAAKPRGLRVRIERSNVAMGFVSLTVALMFMLPVVVLGNYAAHSPN